MRLTLVLVVGLVGCAKIDDNLSQQEQEVSSERAQLVASTRASIAFRGVTAVPDAPRVRKKLVRLGICSRTTRSCRATAMSRA